MQHFLQRFALLVASVLSGFDRLVFKGKLCPLYAPEGMNCLLSANGVAHNEFKHYAAEVTKRVVEAAGVPQAKAQGLYRYLNSGKVDKEEVACQRRVRSGLVGVLQCIEPCWTFDWATDGNGGSTIGGEPGKCSHLYHYYRHPIFGWLYVRLQTWFPFEIQIDADVACLGRTADTQGARAHASPRSAGPAGARLEPTGRGGRSPVDRDQRPALDGRGPEEP